MRTYPKGSRVGDVQTFDRSTKISFHHPDYPGSVYRSKDPFSSSWFAAIPNMPDSPNDKVRVADYILAADYTPNPGR